jgi:putative intracellular protease/amidase
MTGSDHWTLVDGTKHPTGFWAEEAVVPLEVFRAAGHSVTIATPGGVVPPVDQASLTDHTRRVIETAPEFAAAIPLTAVDLDEFDAVYVPGGHGPMEDLASNPDSGAILTNALDRGLQVALVCHGPAALLAAVRPDGTNAYAGYRITAFTNTEEEAGGNAASAKWLLQDRLTEEGITVEAGPPFHANVVADRTVVTGQNPASARPLATELADRLG